jgi:hypothetical protein
MAVLDPQAALFVDLIGSGVEEDHILLVLAPLEFLVLDKILFLDLDTEVGLLPGRKYFGKLPAFVLPFLQAAVQNIDIIVAKAYQGIGHHGLLQTISKACCAFAVTPGS